MPPPPHSRKGAFCIYYTKGYVDYSCEKLSTEGGYCTSGPLAWRGGGGVVLCPPPPTHGRELFAFIIQKVMLIIVVRSDLQKEVTVP